MNIMNHLELLLAAFLCCLLHPMTRSVPGFPAKLCIAAALFVLALLGAWPACGDAPAIPAAEWTPVPCDTPDTAPEQVVRFCPEDPVSCAAAEATAAGDWPLPAIEWSG